MDYLAHKDGVNNELLIDHLKNTADLAKDFASEFDNGDVAYQLGLLHDIGKHTINFQNVLSGKLVKQDHAIIAGMFYYSHGLISDKWLKEHMSLIMSGHHVGLYCNFKDNSIAKQMKEYNNLNFTYGPRITLANKFIALSSADEYNDILQYVNDKALNISIDKSDYFDVSNMSENEKMFYVRMLFSCLVDADYTATAEFYDDLYIDKSSGLQLNVGDSLVKLNEYHDNLVVNSDNTLMNQLRNQVYQECEAKGKALNSFCTLTAPTGTGKTLALIKFALENAKAFGKKRIFIVLPYLSIIEQNVKIYEQIFGSDVILRDDSNTEYTDESRLYSDRWTSPIIVTTSVKFFETLFTNKPTNVRKLHQVANSVVVFDECQTLPSNLLSTTLEVLNSLVDKYNTTILFSTATKPSYEYRNHKEYEKVSNDRLQRGSLFQSKPKLLSNMEWRGVEVISNVQKLFSDYEKVKNTEVIFDVDKEYTDDDLVSYFSDKNQVLYIFNTVKHAVSMYQTLCDTRGSANCYIITSVFCAFDKIRIISEINDKLKHGEDVYVAATQCVEAGVDFDFPCGAREFAPFDSEIQAAGRINRNGKCDGKCLVFLYNEHARKDYPSSGYMFASNLSRQLAKQNPDLGFYDFDKLDDYFCKLYKHSSSYNGDLNKLYEAMQYDDYQLFDDNYNMIDKNSSQAIFIVPPKGDRTKYDVIIANIKAHDYTISKNLMKSALQLTVTVYTSKSKNPDNVGTRLNLRMKCGDCVVPTNWYILNDESLYSDVGLDISKCSSGFFM